jgi:hypothetical protein
MKRIPEECQSTEYGIPCGQPVKYYIKADSVAPHFCCEECAQAWKKLKLTGFHVAEIALGEEWYE